MKPEQEVRAALNTTTNVNTLFDSTYSSEIEKQIDKMIVDILNNNTPLRAWMPRKSMNGQLSYFWHLRTANNTSTAFYSDGGSGTAATGTKVVLQAIALSFRTDWEVTGLMEAGSASYYSALADEIHNAAVNHALIEEYQIILGDDVGAGLGNSANGFLGMKQIVNSFVTMGDTDTVFGVQRQSTYTYMDSAVVAGGADALDLPELDQSITAIEKRAGQAAAIVCSHDKADEISQLLQSQQRFQGTLNLEGGFTVATYRGVPIIKSIAMAYGGASDTDTAIYVLGAGIWEMRVLKETTNTPVAQTRSDVEGGFLKTYEVLVCKDLTKNCLLSGLSA